MGATDVPVELQPAIRTTVPNRNKVFFIRKPPKGVEASVKEPDERCVPSRARITAALIE